MISTNGDTVGEARENVPLKTRAKKNSWAIFSCKNDDCFGGSKLVTLSFAGLTVAITISLIIQIYYGDYQIVPHGSVATDSTECSSIGVDILKRGGNAVDAAIASTLCLAVVNPHNTGLDARGLLMIYSHRTRSAPEIIDFSNETHTEIENVPLTRLLIGMAYAHFKYGKLSWKDLVKPAANLASQGFSVSLPLAQAIGNTKVEHLFPNFLAGKKVTLGALGSTLHQVADLPKDRVQEMFTGKHHLSLSEAVKSSFYNYNIFVPDYPTVGPLLLQNLQQINNITDTGTRTGTDLTKPEFVYNLAEMLQKLYAESQIDENFSEGTSSNVAAVDTDDLYVSLVTGMFTHFGSQEMTPRGYILDVNSTANFSVRLPVIITDKTYICGRRIVMGSGDVSVVTQIITALLLAGENATSGVETPRFTLINGNTIGLEGSRKVKFSEAVSLYLQSLGKVENLSEPYRSCNIVEKIRDDLSSHSDSRGGGLAYRF